MERTRNFRWLLSVTALAFGFLVSKPLSAQTAEGERGRIEIGIRQLYGDRRSAKFNEYRDIPQGAFIQSSEINLGSLLDNTFFVRFQSRDALEEDQSYLLNLGVYRKYRLDLQWDQTPHVFTDTGRSFFLETTPGVFTAPPPLRSLLQSDPGNLRPLLESARLLDLSLRRDRGAGTFTYTPSTDWDVQLQYSREKQSGYRPFGTTINSFSNTLEMPEPIDYRTHQVKVGTEYARRAGGFQASYSGSIFSNETGTLIWDNPFSAADGVNRATRGRLDLYPDNSAHRLTFAGALNFSHATRVMASVAPGWMRQDDPFLPFTINTAVPNVPALPAASLHGSKQTLAMNYTLTSEAIPRVPLTLRFRTYDYNNNTPSLVFTDYVRTDAVLGGTSRRNLPYAYDKKNLGLEAAWEFRRKSWAKFVYEWERYNREHRDVSRSDEHTVGTTFDFNPRNWLLLRASYRHSNRDPEHYEPNEESFPLGEPATALGQLPALRKFDEASRTRHRAETLLEITPVDQLTFGASYGTTQDNYQETGCTWLGFDQCYGLLKDINYNYTFEMTFNPNPAVTLFAEYTREKYKYRQRSRQRVPPTATVPANDDPNNDWESNRRDLVDVWSAGLDGSITERALYSLFYSLSTAKNTVSTRALGSAAIPRFLVTTAEDYPDTSNRWHQLVASVKFPFSGGFAPKLEYRYEKYDRVDFQLERLSEYTILDPGAATSVFLGVGADVPGYDAHILSVSLEYRF